MREDAVPTPSFDAPLAGRLDELSEGDVRSPHERFQRAQARMALGRDAAAREDLEALVDPWGDAALVELAYLDLRERGELSRTIETAKGIADRAGEDVLLRARALHVLGMALGRSGEKAEAMSVLLKAAGLYDEAGHDVARAHVFDTLGTVNATLGRLDLAAHHYAMSVVDKALLGDRRGLAVTIGNLGRLQLRAGRFREAIHYFCLLYTSDAADDRPRV